MRSFDVKQTLPLPSGGTVTEAWPADAVGAPSEGWERGR